MATNQKPRKVLDRQFARSAAAKRPPRARPRLATPAPRPVEYSPSTQQWLAFLAGLLAQTAWAERSTADASSIPSHP
jgi:hypothetical protein